MDRIDAMAVFVRVAQSKSFSKTADEMGLPRATVSMAVRQLEARLGMRLLHRTTRNVSLTGDGEIMLARIIAVLDSVSQLEGDSHDEDAWVRGLIRVEAPTRMARLLLMPRLSELLNQYPDLQIDLRSTDRMVDLIAEGVDVAIRGGEIANSNLVARSLGHLALINCASPQYIEQFGMPISSDDLDQHWVVQLASPTTGKVVPWEYNSEHGLLTLCPPARVTVNNVETYIAAAHEGFGLIQVPAYDVQTELLDGRLIEVLPHERAPSMPLFAVYPHRRHLPKRVRVFMNWVEQLVVSIRENTAESA